MVGSGKGLNNLLEGLYDEICFFIYRCTTCYCGSIYPNSIFNNQSFKEERRGEYRKAQRGVNFRGLGRIIR